MSIILLIIHAFSMYVVAKPMIESGLKITAFTSLLGMVTAISLFLFGYEISAILPYLISVFTLLYGLKMMKKHGNGIYKKHRGKL